MPMSTQNKRKSKQSDEYSKRGKCECREFMEFKPAETWKSSIISYARNEKSEMGDGRVGRKTDSTKEIPRIRENCASPITILQFTLSPFCTRRHPRALRRSYT